MFSLSNKIAVVTGASQELEKEKTFSSSGAHVICVARNKDKLKDLVSQITEDGNSASFISCDISNGGSIENALKDVLKA